MLIVPYARLVFRITGDRSMENKKEKENVLNTLAIVGVFAALFYLYGQIHAQPHKAVASSSHPSLSLSAPAPTTAPAPVQSASTGQAMPVFGKPTVDAHFIDTILCEASSPACGTGQQLYNAAVAQGIDPVMPLAFFDHESSFGKAGMARVTHSLGNLRCIDGAACVNTDGLPCQAGQSCYAAFPPWQTGAGYNAWAALIAGPYYAGEGRTTIELIIPKYAPQADHNNEQAYIDSVEAAVRLWRSGKAVLP